MSRHCHQYLGLFHQNNWISSEFRGQPQACKKMSSLPMNDLSFSLPRNFFRRTGDSQGGKTQEMNLASLKRCHIFVKARPMALPAREIQAHGSNCLRQAARFRQRFNHTCHQLAVRKAIDSKGRWCCSCYVPAMMGACSLWIRIKPKWSLG